MNWDILKSSLEGLQTRGTNLQQKIRGLRRRLTLLLAVVGPGLITSNVDNDAGGIATYSQAGAQYGYALLWSLIPMTIALYVTEEMCARMGVITGKGLSDLIREEFGFRPTFFVMVTGFFVDLANVVAEFAGVAASMEMFHVSRYIAVPIAAILVWILVLRGTYRQVEVIFLIACGFYVTYIISAILAKPDWLEAAKHVVIPNLQFNSGYLLTLTALVGTTIAPWQFFYLQAGFVEKKVGPRQYPQAALTFWWAASAAWSSCFSLSSPRPRLCMFPASAISPMRSQAAKALIPLAGQMGRIYFRVRFIERLALCGHDFAALDRPCDLRRAGI